MRNQKTDNKQLKWKKEDIIGKWNTYRMENGDEEYFNEEVQAYIKIENNKIGEFHFGYVQAEINGEIENLNEREYSSLLLMEVMKEIHVVEENGLN